MADLGKSTPSVDEIYEQLTRGVGREFVTDENVPALIEKAQRDRHTVLAEELREWVAPCGGDAPSVPTTMAPTRGFNKENVRH